MVVENGREFAAGEGVGPCLLETSQPEVAGDEVGRVFDESTVVWFQGDKDTTGLEGTDDFGDGRFQFAKPHQATLAEDEVKAVGRKREVKGIAINGENGLYVRY